MQPLPTPSNISWKEGIIPNEGTVIIEPCYPGYGTTLGNALRRVLLSSLPGAAVVAVKIKNVLHEFSTLPNVKEDMIQLILNLKKVRAKIFNGEEVRVVLKAHGIKEVTAGDIEHSSAFQIINPEMTILTLTSDDAEIEMEITFRQGRGYLATEEREQEQREIGNILVDALFSPIVNVGFRVEHIRVGEMTNFERVSLSITTDGSLTPQEAFAISTDTILQQFEALKGVKQSHGSDVVLPPDIDSEVVSLVNNNQEEASSEAPKKKKAKAKKEL